MSQPEILYRFTPPFEGAFLQGVPQRDLTQRDVDALSPVHLRDAFAPHPLHGTALYTATPAREDFLKAEAERIAQEEAEAELAAAIDGQSHVEFIEGSIVIDPTHPKWFQARQAKAAEEHILLAPPLPDETAKAYDERMEAFSNGDLAPQQDGDA